MSSVLRDTCAFTWIVSWATGSHLFCFSKQESLRCPRSVMKQGSATPRRLLTVSPFFHFLWVLTTAACEHLMSFAISEILVPSCRAVTIFPLSKSLKATAFPNCVHTYLVDKITPLYPPAAINHHLHRQVVDTANGTSAKSNHSHSVGAVVVF